MLKGNFFVLKKIQNGKTINQLVTKIICIRIFYIIMIDIFKYVFNNMIKKSNFKHTLKHKCLTLKNFNYWEFETLKYP